MSETTDRTSLGDRMKVYEKAGRTMLPRRMPVILRIDGKAFHSFAAHFVKPFDEGLIRAMDEAAIELCQEIQGAQFAFVQSDEISILVHNYKRLNTEAWFDNQTQKMASVAAAIAAASVSLRYERRAHFDARAFVLPEAEVCNYFIWRQQDWTRNSIQMCARSLYSHKQCDGKVQSEMQEMCFQAGLNWNDLPVRLRRGRCIVRAERGWHVDNEPPIFTQDREYVERHLAVESDKPSVSPELRRARAFEEEERLP